jgi:hypothetical protein
VSPVEKHVVAEVYEMGEREAGIAACIARPENMMKIHARASYRAAKGMIERMERLGTDGPLDGDVPGG